MTYAQTAGNLSTTAGVPFVTVGAGPQYTFQTQQAANTAVSTPGNEYYGYAVWIVGSTVSTTQYTWASQTTTLMYAGGGIATGPAVVGPEVYLQFTGASAVNDAAILSNVSALVIYGVAIVHNVAGMRSAFRVTGCRNVYISNLFANAFYTATPAAGGNGAGLLVDGVTQTGDSNVFIQPIGIGDPGYQCGVSTGDTFQMNDCTYVGAIFEGPAFVVGTTSNCIAQFNTGTNHNFMGAIGCHSAPGPTQTIVSAPSGATGSVTFSLSEMGVSGGAGTLFNQAATGWTTYLDHFQWSSGASTFSAGNIYISYCRVTGASSSPTFSGATGWIDHTNFSSASLTITHSSGQVWWDHCTIACTSSGGLTVSGGSTVSAFHNCLISGTLTIGASGRSYAQGGRITGTLVLSAASANFGYDAFCDVFSGTIDATNVNANLYVPQSSFHSAGAANYGWGTVTALPTNILSLNTLSSTPTTAVALGTASTAILSVTPASGGLYEVLVNVTSLAGAITGTVVVTYTDLATNATATQSIAVPAIGTGAGASYAFLCNAKKGVAIAVSGTASTGSDLDASAVIRLA